MTAWRLLIIISKQKLNMRARSHQLLLHSHNYNIAIRCSIFKEINNKIWIPTHIFRRKEEEEKKNGCAACVANTKRTQLRPKHVLLLESREERNFHEYPCDNCYLLSFKKKKKKNWPVYDQSIVLKWILGFISTMWHMCVFKCMGISRLHA